MRSCMAKEEPKKRGPKAKPASVRATITTSLRLYRTDLWRLNKVQQMLKLSTQHEHTATEVFRHALIRLEAELDRTSTRRKAPRTGRRLTAREAQPEISSDSASPS